MVKKVPKYACILIQSSLNVTMSHGERIYLTSQKQRATQIAVEMHCGGCAESVASLLNENLPQGDIWLTLSLDNMCA